MECDAIRDQMLDVLYGEADADATACVERHLSACSACREELAGLRSLRQTLACWRLPRQRRSVRRLAPPRYFWAAAAAAVVILALGGALAIAGLQMSFTRGPVVVRLGGAAPATGTEALPRGVQPALTATQPLLPAASTSDAESALLLQRMAEMIRQSESRQRVAFRTSLSEFEERTTRQRRYDMARIGAGLSYLDGKTGQHMARTTELMGYMVQASNRREP